MATTPIGSFVGPNDARVPDAGAALSPDFAAAIAPTPAPDPDTLPSTYSYRAAFSTAERQAAVEFVEEKGGPDTELRPRLAALCLAYWTQHIAGRVACCTADLRALYPVRPGQRLPAAATISKVLTEGREHGVFEALGKGWYRVTPFGAVIVASLPDDALVGTVYGQRSAVRSHRHGTPFIRRHGEGEPAR